MNFCVFLQVTEADAQDVVHLLQESILDACTTDSGVIDFNRKGGMSIAKQVSYIACQSASYNLYSVVCHIHMLITGVSLVLDYIR